MSGLLRWCAGARDQNALSPEADSSVTFGMRLLFVVGLRKHACVHTCTRACMRAYTHRRTHMQACMRTRRYHAHGMHAYMHLYIRAYTIHYTCMPSLLSWVCVCVYVHTHIQCLG